MPLSLREERVFANRTGERGRIPGFLAERRAEQVPGTARGYEGNFTRFLRSREARGITKVGQITESVAHAYIQQERVRGQGNTTIQDPVRQLTAWTRWMARDWTEAERWADVKTLAAELPDIELIPDEARWAEIPIFYTATRRSFTRSRSSAMRGPGTQANGPSHAGHRHPRDGARPASVTSANEAIIVKKYASAFFDTDLIARLNARRIDTPLVVGCTTSGCVRATVVDALQSGLRPIVIREAVGDPPKRLTARTSSTWNSKTRTW